MSQKQKHLIFSTNPAALAQYKECLSDWSEDQVELFSFSEQEKLDMSKVDGSINGLGEQAQASVLLLATGQSSYLWFNSQHFPRTVELCSAVKKRLNGRIRIVVCATNSAAKEGLDSSRDHVQQLCEAFFSGPADVIVWGGFDSSYSVNPGGVKSLVPDKKIDARPQGHRFWPTGPINYPILVLALLLGFLLGCCFPWIFEELVPWTDKTEKAAVGESERLHQRKEMLDEKNKLAEEAARIDKDGQAAAIQSKANEEESERLHQAKDRLDEESQTLAKRSKRLDKTQHAVVVQQGANENESERLGQRKELLDKKNQTLAEKGKRIDEQKQAAILQERADERFRQFLYQENQTLAGKSKMLHEEERSAVLHEREEKEKNERLHALLDKEKQTLAEKRKKLDEEKQAAVAQQKASQDESERLRQRKDMLDEKDQTLAEKSLRLETEKQLINSQKARNDEESKRLRKAQESQDEQSQTQGRKRWSVLILLCICIVVVASFASTFLSFLSPVDHVDCPRPSLADEACSPKESGQFCDESNVEYARLPEAPAQADLQPRREDAGTNQQHPSGFFSRSRFLLTLLRKSLSSRAPRLVLSPWFTKRRLPRPSRMVQPREH